MTIRGEGNAGIRKGSHGNLIVYFEEKEHEYFIRNENDILLDLHISPTEAVLGTKVEVPTLSTKVELSIPPGTQPGKMLRLKNKGLPHLHGVGKGDQIVRIRVDIPTIIGGKEKQLYSELSELEGKNRNPQRRYSKIR